MAHTLVDLSPLPEKPFLSVVIPAYNEEKYIGKTLSHLMKQTLPKDRYEILVVVSEKTIDKTAEIVRSYGGSVVMSAHGVGNQRAEGFKRAKGDIFVGTDADTVVPEIWLSAICEDITKGAVAATGPNRLDPHARFMMQLIYTISMEVYRLVGLIQKKIYFSGLNFAVRKDVYVLSGGFNSSLKTGEDTDLANRIQPFGKIVYDKRLTSYTSARRYRTGYVRQYVYYIWAFFAVKLGKNPPEMPAVR